jgi:hypothetical protein
MDADILARLAKLEEQVPALEKQVTALESALDVEKSNRGNEDNRLSRQIGSLQTSERQWSVTQVGIKTEASKWRAETMPFRLDSTGVVLILVNGYLRFNDARVFRQASEFVIIEISLIKADDTLATDATGTPIQPHRRYFPVSQGTWLSQGDDVSWRIGFVAFPILYQSLPPNEYKLRLQVPTDWFSTDGRTGDHTLWSMPRGMRSHAIIMTLPTTNFIVP